MSGSRQAKIDGLGRFLNAFLGLNYDEIEKRIAASQSVGTAKPKEPTKTGSRVKERKPKRSRSHVKAERERAASQREANKGRFFLRRHLIKKMIDDPTRMGVTIWGERVTMWGEPAKREVTQWAESRVAKVMEDRDLWIRKAHVPDDMDPSLWSKAKNAKPERINQEIRQIAGYLDSGEMLVEEAEFLLDWLYEILGSKL